MSQWPMRVSAVSQWPMRLCTVVQWPMRLCTVVQWPMQWCTVVSVANAVVYSGQCGQCRVCLRSAVPGPGARWYPSWPYTWMPPPYYRVPHHHPPLPGTPPLAEYGAHYASRPDKNVNFPKMGAKWVLQKTTVGVGSAPLLLSQ